MKPLFALNPGVHFLNHGSYGACPRAVLERFFDLHREMEAQPVEFLNRRAPGLLRGAREALGEFIGSDPARTVLVRNATQAVNAAAWSAPLHPGEVVLSTSHEYGAMDRMWRAVCAAKGAVYETVPLPFPAATRAEMAERILSRMDGRVKVLFLSHLTSPSALRLPVEVVVPAARAAGVVTIVDGAHAPGQIPLNLGALDADAYIGNCHKWMCAPKGAGFLAASARAAEWLEPRCVSWGHPAPGGERFVGEMEYQGTDDLCSALCVAEAIRFQRRHDWDRVRARCTELLAEAEAEVMCRTGLPSLYGEDPSVRCPQMAAFKLPDGDPAEYKRRLLKEHAVEAPVFSFGGQVVVRVSIQAYNTGEDVAALAGGVARICETAAR